MFNNRVADSDETGDELASLLQLLHASHHHQVATVVTSDQVLSPPSVECKIGFPEM